MKRLIGLIAVILITATSASGLVNTNSVNITVGDTAGHNYKQFDFTWSGFDDQSITFVLDRVITNHTWTFKLSKDTITGQVAYVSQAASVSTSNITLTLSRTNVPPNASYKASLRGVDDTSTLGVDVARGKISITDSIFDDADGTFSFPDRAYSVIRAGDAMTGGLTNTTARGFVGNGGNLTNISVVASTVDHGGLGGLGDDDHTGYRLESADHTHASTGMQAGQLDHGSAITGLTDDDHTIYRLESADHTHASTGMQAGKIDHGTAIDGLTDDDHTQYRLEAADHTHVSTGIQAGQLDHGNALSGFTDDDHTIYRLESADHTHATTGLQAGTLDHGAALTGMTDDDHTQYRLESEDHTHASTGAQAGTIDHGVITGVTDDDHTIYRLESADHTHASTGIQAGTIDHGVITGATDDDHTIYRLESADHTHASTGMQAGKIDHGTAIDGLTDDDHTQYRLESADHTHASTGAEAGTVAHSALTGLTSGDPHTQYLEIDGTDTMTGDLLMTTAKAIGISSGGEIEFTDTTVDLIKMLVANVRVGDGTPSYATAVEELYVEGDIESGAKVYLNSAAPELYFADTTAGEEVWKIMSGSNTVHGASLDGLHFADNDADEVRLAITDTGGNLHVTLGHVVAERQVVVATGVETLTIAEAKGSFITMNASNTINLPASATAGMEVTILVIADVAVTIADNAAGDLIWKDGSTDTSIVCSGSAGECITLTFVGSLWYAHTIEGSWILQ